MNFDDLLLKVAGEIIRKAESLCDSILIIP
jgi:hypothetical protein